MSRWTPKLWRRPRSRRWRDQRARESHPDVRVECEILRRLYPLDYEPVRPAWADTARKFGWITLVEYYAIKPRMVATGRGSLMKRLYSQSPMIGLLRKAAP